MPETITAVMARWAADLRFEDLSEGAIHEARRYLLDSLGCAFGGLRQEDCHIARESARAMQAFLGKALSIDMDTVIAGAILADVGKPMEYDLVDGKLVQSERGRLLRHPFTGVAVAMECGVPDAVCHIIAAHAAEGDLVKRSTEAYIVHHADFMSFLPFKNR